MISCIVTFSRNIPVECIKDICLEFNVVAMVLDELNYSWCLDTENGTNLYELGSHFNDRIGVWYSKHPERFNKKPRVVW